MKNASIYFTALSIVVLLALGIHFYQKGGFSPSGQEIVTKNPGAQTNEDNNTDNTSNKINLEKLDKFAFEVSREICKQEQNALSLVVEPTLKNIASDPEVPLDSDAKLTPKQAIEWLRKTATSKCSAFRKNNAEHFFDSLAIDESNYKSSYLEFGHVLEEYRGFTPYRLIRKSLEALNKASLEESKSLKEATLFSLTAFISDASSQADLVGLLFALKDAQEKGLIVHPSVDQIKNIKQEYDEAGERSAVKGQQLLQKYIRADTDFSALTRDKIVDMLGYEGVKAELEHEHQKYLVVRQFAQRLNHLMAQNF